VRIVGAKHEHDKPLDERALTAEQAGRLVAETPPKWRLLVEMMLQTGLRFSEASALDCEDLNGLHIHVRQSLYRGAMDDPKSEYGKRSIPISRAMAQRLWQQRAGRADHAPLFTNQHGGRLAYTNMFNRIFKPAARRAGVGWAGWHTLRHTCATELFNRGTLDAKQVQIWLGHHDPIFTLAKYVHTPSGDLPPADFWDEPGVPSVSPPAETVTTVTAADAGNARFAGVS
jgi:integrase